MQFVNNRLGFAIIGEDDTHAGVQKRQFAQAMLQSGEVEDGFGEGFGRRQKGDFGAAFLGRAGNRQVALGLTVAEDHLMALTATRDGQPQFRRQGVDHRHADAV